MKLYKTYKLTSIINLIIFLVALISLFIFSKQNLVSAQNTIKLFFMNVMPSLFPFILFTEIILKTDVLDTFIKIIGGPLSKLLRLNKACIKSVIIGFLCGFPMGAKAVISDFENKKISKDQAKVLLSFINNCNPIFVISTTGICLFKSIKIGLLLLLSHILSAILSRYLLNLKINNNIILKNDQILKSFNQKNNINAEYSSFFDILRKSISNSFVTLSMILGFMLIFNMLSDITTSILYRLNINVIIAQFISGIFEVTNGCYNISTSLLDIKLKISIISFLLGFSGLCINFQIYSVIYKNKFSLKKLLKSKIIQGIISFIITYILVTLLKLEDSTLITSFSNFENATNTYNIYDNLKIFYILQIFLIGLFLLFIYVKMNSKNKKQS